MFSLGNIKAPLARKWWKCLQRSLCFCKLSSVNIDMLGLFGLILLALKCIYVSHSLFFSQFSSFAYKLNNMVNVSMNMVILINMTPPFDMVDNCKFSQHRPLSDGNYDCMCIHVAMITLQQTVLCNILWLIVLICFHMECSNKVNMIYSFFLHYCYLKSKSMKPIFDPSLWKSMSPP